MAEGWRTVRVEENSAEIEKAGYHIDVESGITFTDAPLDWSPDDFAHISPEGGEKQFSPANGGADPVISEEKKDVPSEKQISTDPPKKISVDDLFNDFRKPTEVDEKIESGEIDPDAPKPEQENAVQSEQGSRFGKLTDAEFEETKMAVEIFHHALVNGNAWAMQTVSGEGKIEDYKQIDKAQFDRWAVIGAKLCDKYGVKIPLEALYLMSAGQNMGPAWQLAIQNYKQRKKIEKLEEKNEKLRWENFVMQNAGKINPNAPPPPPTKDYPTNPPPQPTADLHIQELNGWVYNSIDDDWTHRTSKTKYPNSDGDYIFNPDLGVMVHKVTGIKKNGRPKGQKDKKPRKMAPRGPGGKFLSKAEREKLATTE